MPVSSQKVSDFQTWRDELVWVVFLPGKKERVAMKKRYQTTSNGLCRSSAGSPPNRTSSCSKSTFATEIGRRKDSRWMFLTRL
jgi:hypothetical protein